MSLNDVVHERVLSESSLVSEVLTVSEKYQLSEKQRGLLRLIGRHCTSLLWGVELQRGGAEWLQDEMAGILTVIQEEGEPFREAFIELFRAIEERLPFESNEAEENA